jgi:6-phosphogluconolactonase/glucosamine-6-phosphate isomerase/deaminase
VKEILFGPIDTERLPAQLIRPASSTATWLLDRTAASQLPKDSYRIVS